MCSGPWKNLSLTQQGKQGGPKDHSLSWMCGRFIGIGLALKTCHLSALVELAWFYCLPSLAALLKTKPKLETHCSGECYKHPAKRPWTRARVLWQQNTEPKAQQAQHLHDLNLYMMQSCKTQSWNSGPVVHDDSTCHVYLPEYGIILTASTAVLWHNMWHIIHLLL